MEELFLGIDLGTTSVKSAELDQAGTPLARFGQSYPTTHPAPGMAKQDPGDWMRLIAAALSGFAAFGAEAKAKGWGGERHRHRRGRSRPHRADGVSVTQGVNAIVVNVAC